MELSSESSDEKDDNQYLLMFDKQKHTRLFQKNIKHSEMLGKIAAIILSLFNENKCEEYPEIVQWFKDMQDLLSYDHSDIQTKRRTPLLRAMTDSMVSHRWDELNKMIHSHVSREILPRVYIIWKVSMELGMRNDTFEAFVELMKFLKSSFGTNVFDVSLDFGLYLISLGRFDEAYVMLTDIPANRVLPDTHVDCNEKELYTRLLVNLYTGLIFYAKWEMLRYKIIDMESRSAKSYENEELMKDLRCSKSELYRHSNKAIEYFKKLKEKKGVFDVFIEKYVILLCYNSQEEEAFEVLKSYAENNSDNPNVHRYIYDFCIRYEVHLNEQINALKKFCDAIPSDEYGLILHSIMIKNPDTYLESLHVIFDLLDYNCWRHNTNMWARLLKQLTDKSYDIKNSSQFIEAWNRRKGWWPAYHFNCAELNTINFDDDALRKAIHIKMLLSIELLGPDNEFSILYYDLIK